MIPITIIIIVVISLLIWKRFSPRLLCSSVKFKTQKKPVLNSTGFFSPYFVVSPYFVSVSKNISRSFLSFQKAQHSSITQKD